jgi:hypothetical protein
MEKNENEENAQGIANRDQEVMKELTVEASAMGVEEVNEHRIHPIPILRLPKFIGGLDFTYRLPFGTSPHGVSSTRHRQQLSSGLGDREWDRSG